MPCARPRRDGWRPSALPFDPRLAARVHRFPPVPQRRALLAAEPAFVLRPPRFELGGQGVARIFAERIGHAFVDPPWSAPGSHEAEPLILRDVKELMGDEMRRPAAGADQDRLAAEGLGRRLPLAENVVARLGRAEERRSEENTS